MKLPYLSAVLLLLAPLNGLVATAGEKLSNPGFESGLAGWTIRNGGTLLNSSPGHSGTNAARVTGRTSTSHGVQQSLLGVLPTGTFYFGSAWVRTSSTTNVTVNLNVQQNDARGNRTVAIDSIQVANTWKKMTETFAFDPNGTLTALSLYVSGPPSGVDIYIDDVSLAPLDPGAIENLLENPGMESGTTNWAGHFTTIVSSPLAHTGTNCVAATNRDTGTFKGIEQSLTGKLQIGRTYFVSAWVRTDQPTNNTVKLTFQRDQPAGTSYFTVATGQASSNSWTWLSGYYTPQTTSTVTALKFFVEGPPARVALYLDDAYVAPATGLRKAAANYPTVRLGAGGVSQSELKVGPPLFGAFVDAFHHFSPGNALKMQPMQPGSNFWSFAEANMLLDFAQAHGGSSRGHVFVWHSQVATWATSAMPTDQLQAILWDRIDTAATYYRDRLPYWDVVNEAFSDSGGALRSTLWYDSPGIGYAANGNKYIAESFKRARTNIADCALIYNDYSIETVNTKSTAVYNMLSSFVSQGVPVDGIGFQAHLSGTSFDSASFYSNLQRFQSLGLDLHITELDVRLPVDTNGYASASDLAGQGDVYFDVLGTALGFSNLKVFQLWGIYDGDSWIPGSFPGFGQALPFDFNLGKKPAYWGMWNALAGQAEKLTVTSLSSGDTTAVVTNSSLNASKGLRLNADAASDFITLEAEVPFQGQWSVKVGVLKTSSSGRFQLAVAAPGSGSFANVSTSKDTYAASTSASEIDLGTNTFSAAGDWQFRFKVPAKNASSSGYDLTLDYIRLTPVACEPRFTQPLADQSLPVNGALASALFIAEDDLAAGSLVVTATSSNPALVPNANLVLAGGSPYFTLAATPVTNRAGTTVISLVADDGTTTVTNSFVLTVGSAAEVALAPVANQTMIAGQWLHLTNVASSSGGQSSNFSFSLLSAPVGATLNVTNGILDWRPTLAQAPSTNTFTVTVTDNGTPSLSATQSFTVTVRLPVTPQMTAPLLTNGLFRLLLSGDLGPDYTVETSEDLLVWQALFSTNPAVVPFFWTDRGASNSPMRFYRVILGP